MMEKKVSVIIPVIEDNTYLIRCINSLKKQTVSLAEIIIAEYDVEVKTKYEDGVYCLSEGDELRAVRTNMEIEYQKNDFYEQIFDEERRIAANVKKAVSLASGDYILFCNVTSVLSPATIEELLKAYTNGMCAMAKICNVSNGLEEFDGTELIWGKLFTKSFLTQSKIYKWNFMEILRWIDNEAYENVGVVDNAIIYEDSYEEIIQKVFTVKLKDDVPKFRKYFVRRIKNGQELFEHINTYDYVKINIVTNLIEKYLDNFDMVIELTHKYVVPIFNNRMNAKKNRKEILHQSLINFFSMVEKDKVHYEMILMLFCMDIKMIDIFKECKLDTFDKIYTNWCKMMNI